MAEINVNFVIIDVQEELPGMNRERNCRDRANKNQSGVVEVEVFLLQAMGQSSCLLQDPSRPIS